MSMDFTRKFGLPTLTGVVAPTSTPAYTGQQYINTVSGDVYIATGTTASYNWALVGKGATSAFDVSTVGNMFAWWSADYGITKDAGDLVSSWVDKVNGWAVVQATGYRQPDFISDWKNGQPALSFDGVNDDMIKTGITSSTSYTTFTVVSVDATETSDSTLIYLASYSRAAAVSLNPSEFYVGEAGFTKLGTYTVGDSYLITQRVTGSAGTLYGTVNNGAETSVYSGLTEIIDALKFGGTWSSDAYNTNCHIAELLIYNANLTPENIATVKAYLNNKYAIY